MQKKTIPMFYCGEKQSFAAAVVAGDLVFCSGVDGRLPETGRVRVEAVGVQYWDALDKLKATLEKAGTSLENIVQMDSQTIPEEAITLWEGPIGFEFFQKHSPELAESTYARSSWRVPNLCFPEQMVNLNAIAVMPGVERKSASCLYGGSTKVDYSKKQTFGDVVVGDLVFLSGQSGRLSQTGRVRNGVAGVQARDALDKIKANLEKAGTSLENIVRIVYMFVANEGVTLWEGPIMDYFRKHAPSLAENMPAITGCGLKGLCFPEQLVEMEVIAVTPEAKPKVQIYPWFYAHEKQTFAAAVKVGDLVFCSGQTGQLSETGRVRNQSARVQAVDALNKVKSTLEEVGTSLDNIVRIDYYFVGNLGETLWEGPIMDYFREHAPELAQDMPAVNRCALKNLWLPDQLVEIEVIAVISG